MDEKMTKRGDAQRWHFSHESLARFAYLLLAICAIINQLLETRKERVAQSLKAGMSS